MKIKILLFIFICVFITNINAQTLPKREFRAVWIATVTNLDWPSNNNLSTEEQKNQLLKILDSLKALRINSVIFQVRTESDAFYNSPYEPWSYWLTGNQGTPPNPYYDPLEFAIDEAHKRGLEIHAWFNPYRADRALGDYPVSSNHITVTHPEWILNMNNKFKILNPGLPIVRDYIATVISDVVRRYDVDGVHFDDYFYPYPPDQITYQDTSTFREYSRGFTDIKDWRRDNVNVFIAQVKDSIKSIKPKVKFGISPFGIWKNGVPTGITGLSAYDDIYCDALAWLRNQSIDYLTPQLYWPFGGGQDYGKLMPWWADSVNAYGRHFYPGEAAYRISTISWTASEMPHHIRFGRENPKRQGNVFFRANMGLLDNPKGFSDSLRNDLYRFPSLNPIMKWIDSIPPNPIQNLEFVKFDNVGRAGLIWDEPLLASDGDSSTRYIIYNLSASSFNPDELEDPANILDIVGNNYYTPKKIGINENVFIGISALDQISNESNVLDVILITKPEIPILANPINNAFNQKDTTLLNWNYAARASFYELQVSTDSIFSSNLLVNESLIADTFFYVSNMKGLQKYYWRVKAKNIAGISEYSQIRNFTTGFPKAPILVYPPHGTTEVPLDTNLIWNSSITAENYNLQLSNSTTFDYRTIILDTTGIVDTTFRLQNLTPNKMYFWRVSASNQYGSSLWSEAFGFKTLITSIASEESEIPSEYALYQNYPNPFNPTTTIKFALPIQSKVELKIFDILGQEVKSLINDYLNSGNYTIEWDSRNNNGEKVSSGIYIYRISAGNFFQAKKMILLY